MLIRVMLIFAGIVIMIAGSIFGYYSGLHLIDGFEREEVQDQLQADYCEEDEVLTRTLSTNFADVNSDFINLYCESDNGEQRNITNKLVSDSLVTIFIWVGLGGLVMAIGITMTAIHGKRLKAEREAEDLGN